METREELMEVCKYQLTTWVDDLDEIDFAVEQLQKYRDRKWVLKKNNSGEFAVFVQFNPRPYVESIND